MASLLCLVGGGFRGVVGIGAVGGGTPSGRATVFPEKEGVVCLPPSRPKPILGAILDRPDP